MTWKEMKSDVLKRKDAIIQRLKGTFEMTEVGERDCFVHPEGWFFTLGVLAADKALVIEYADNKNEAHLNRFEDGDLFYVDELDEETMFRMMLEEINRGCN